LVSCVNTTYSTKVLHSALPNHIHICYLSTFIFITARRTLCLQAYTVEHSTVSQYGRMSIYGLVIMFKTGNETQECMNLLVKRYSSASQLFAVAVLTSNGRTVRRHSDEKSTIQSASFQPAIRCRQRAAALLLALCHVISAAALIGQRAGEIQQLRGRSSAV